MAKSASTYQYVTAKRFLNELDDSIKALQEPEATDILSGKCAAQGKTIAELVAYLKSKGYIFGPALADDGKAAYRAIYIDLRNYDDRHGSRLRETRVDKAEARFYPKAGDARVVPASLLKGQFFAEHRLMKLRLQIAQSPNASIAFEHHGSSVAWVAIPRGNWLSRDCCAMPSPGITRGSI